ALKDAGHRREGNMGAISDLYRALRSGWTIDDVGWAQAVAGNSLNCLVHPRPVVGEINRERRRSGRHDGKHIGLVQQVPRDAPEEIADARRLMKIQMQIVDEE